MLISIKDFLIRVELEQESECEIQELSKYVMDLMLFWIEQSTMSCISKENTINVLSPESPNPVKIPLFEFLRNHTAIFVEQVENNWEYYFTKNEPFPMLIVVYSNSNNQVSYRVEFKRESNVPIALLLLVMVNIFLSLVENIEE